MQNSKDNIIRLVYSASSKVDKKAESEHASQDQIWGQLDLFTSEKPDTIIFAQPDQLGLNGIEKIVGKGHAKRIIDLRTMPFISFGNESRFSFLKVLSENHIEYLNIFNISKKIGDLNSDIENSEINKTLKPLIQSGPTIIFSESAPDQDKLVKRLLALLDKAEVTHSTVFANED